MNILRNSLIVALINLTSRISGYIRDILFAIFFGTAPILDILIYAIKLPQYFKILLLDTAFNSALIPKILSIKNKELYDSELIEFIYKIFFIFIIIAIPIILIFEIFAPSILLIISPGFVLQHDFELFTKISRIIFPYLFFLILNSFLIAILNSGFKFALAASIQIIFNIAIISSLIISSLLNLQILIITSISIIIGGVFQSFVLFSFINIKFNKIKFSFNENLKIINFFKLYLPGIIISGVVTINSIFAFWIATFYESSVSYLYYADRIFELPHSILSLSIATVLLPSISKFIILNDYKSALMVQQKAFLYTVYFILPATFFLIFYPELIIGSLFERGNFNNISTIETAFILKGFAYGLIAYSLSIIFIPYFYATQKMKILFYVCCVIIFINIFIIFILQNYYGYKGISYGVSFSTWIFSLTLFFLMNYYGFNILDKKTINTCVKYLFFNIFLFIFLHFIFQYFSQITSNYILLTLSLIFPGLIFYLLLTYFFERNLILTIIKSVKPS